QEPGPLHVGEQGFHDFADWYALLQGTFCGYAMDLLGIIGDVKAVRPHDKIVAGEEFPPAVVELPGYLNQPRPVVEVCDRGRFVVGYAGSFGVEYEIHSSGLKAATRWENQRFWGSFGAVSGGKFLRVKRIPNRQRRPLGNAPNLILPSFY